MDGRLKTGRQGKNISALQNIFFLIIENDTFQVQIETSPKTTQVGGKNIRKISFVGNNVDLVEIIFMEKRVDCFLSRAAPRVVTEESGKKYQVERGATTKILHLENAPLRKHISSPPCKRRPGNCNYFSRNT